jgi:Helix-turn-helix domain
MLHGDFRQFSVERLLRFLIALGQDVEIVIKPRRGRRHAAQLRVARKTPSRSGRCDADDDMVLEAAVNGQADATIAILRRRQSSLGLKSCHRE